MSVMGTSCPKPLPRQPKKKGARPTERAEAKDQALQAWAAAVKARAGNVCEVKKAIGHHCVSILDAHHVIGKGSRPRLALDVENGVALCREAHHLVHRSRWFKPHFWIWFAAKYPGRRERLLQKAIKEARLA